MFLSIFTLSLLAQASITTHGDITIAPELNGIQATIQIVNRTPQPAALDLSAAWWDAESRRTVADALISTDPRKVTVEPYSNAPVKIQIADANFFGTARLNLGDEKQPLAVLIHRGLIPARDEKIDLRLGESAGFHITNPGSAAISANWLFRTSAGDLCADPDCSSIDAWFHLKVGPRRVARVSVSPRAWWFGRTRGQASLVLNYSRAIDGVEQVEALPIVFFAPGIRDRLLAWGSEFFNWLRPFFRLVWTFVLLAIGAMAFWFANVLLANLQQYSGTLKRLSELRTRVEGISGATASRTRAALKKTCESMAETARGRLLSQDDRNQISQELDAFDRRIQLAEKLDAAYIKRNELCDDDNWPLSVSNEVKAALAEVEGLVSGEVSAEDLARADKMLAAALAIDAAVKVLVGEFTTRLDRVRTDFSRDPWKNFFDTQRANFPSAGALLSIKVDDPDLAKILSSDPVKTDLDLIQLEILSEVVSANPLKNTQEIVEHAQHRSEQGLTRARSLLKQCEEGIREEEIREAIRQKQWYAYCEPETVKLGSTVRLWIRFSRESLNRCAARDSFSCYWNLPDSTFEEGWEAFLVASSLGGFEVRPSFIHSSSNPPEEISKVLDSATGKEADMPSLTPTVIWPKSSGEWKYDMVQLATSLLVPLITVALIELKTAAALGALPLLTAGFTSQLIQSRLLRKDSPGTPA